jgi:Trypsin
MNNFIIVSCLRCFGRAADLLNGLYGRWRVPWLGLCGAALATAAWAVVGPAREAPEYAPYVVMVMYQGGGETDFCTASVIARNVVLTAAHCVRGVSSTRVFYRGGEGKLIVYDVAEITPNPDYRPNARRQHVASIDLALLRLREPLPSSFKPVELAYLGPIVQGQRLRIAGFGRANEDVSGTSGVLRTGVLSAAGPKSTFLAFFVDPAGSGLGGCTGDSGAPIFALDQPVLVAVAIRAKGAGGYACGASTEAVKIGPQLPWIRDTVRGWGTSGPLAR